jgi:hypothetical protein
MNKPIQTSVALQALNSAALLHELVVGAARAVEDNIELLAVMIHFGTAVTQTVTVSHVGVESSTNYLFVLDTSSLSGATNYIFRPSGVAPVFKRGDTIRVACTNSGTPAITAYSKIQYRECA